MKKHADFLTSSKVTMTVVAKRPSGVEFKRDMEATASELSLSSFLINDEKGNIFASKDESASYNVPIAEADEEETYDMAASVFIRSEEFRLAAGASQRELGCEMEKSAFGDVTMSARLALMRAVFDDNHLFSKTLTNSVGPNHRFRQRWFPFATRQTNERGLSQRQTVPKRIWNEPDLSVDRSLV